MDASEGNSINGNELLNQLEKIISLGYRLLKLAEAKYSKEQHNVGGSEQIKIVIFKLYEAMLEEADAVYVLASKSLRSGITSVSRTIFELQIQLTYILLGDDKDMKLRTLAYYVANLKEWSLRLENYEKHLDVSHKLIKEINQELSHPEYDCIVKALDKSKKGYYQKWYSICDNNINSFTKLVKEVHKQALLKNKESILGSENLALYEYGKQSIVAHGISTVYLQQSVEKGEMDKLQVRSVISSISGTTLLILDKYMSPRTLSIILGDAVSCEYHQLYDELNSFNLEYINYLFSSLSSR